MGTDKEDTGDLVPTVTLARLFEKQGLLDKAAAVYKKLIATEPYRQDLRMALGDVEGKGEGQRLPGEKSGAEYVLSQLVKWQTAISNRKKTLDKQQKERGKILVIGTHNLNTKARKDGVSDSGVELKQIDGQIKATAKTYGANADTFESNHKDELVQKIVEASGHYDVLIIDVAGFTNGSAGIRDALMALDIPIIEVHPSNIFSQEALGQKSVIAEVATAHIAGFGKEGYMMAVRAAANMICTTEKAGFVAQDDSDPIRALRNGLSFRNIKK